MKRWLLLTLLALLSLTVRAENTSIYPVEITTMITPPYGTCLKDYVGSKRFMVYALLRDLTKTQENFVIVMTVKNVGGNVIFRSTIGDFQLTPGKPTLMPNEVNNHILHNLFNPSNIEVGQTYATNCFSEGAYTIAFQAFDKWGYPSRRLPLSRESSVTVFMQSTSTSPYLIFPYDGDSICSQSTNVINYQWQPANPTGEAVQYHLEVTDVRAGESAYGAFNSKTDRVLSVKCFNSLYQHPITAANYVEGHTYAWRVRMLSPLNQGAADSVYAVTPVRTFEFRCTAKPTQPDNYDAKITSKNINRKLDQLVLDTVEFSGVDALLKWKKDDVYSNYCGVGIELRKYGQEKWTAFKTTTTEIFEQSLSSLEYNTRYDVRGQYIQCPDESHADTVYAPYSDTLQFMLPKIGASTSAGCGDDIPTLTDCGEKKGKVLSVGDTINANGTNVVVDSIAYNVKDSSIISGRGHLSFPILRNVQVKVRFNEIHINCAGELALGVIRTIYDEATCAMIDLEELSGEGSTGGSDKTTSSLTTEPYDEKKLKDPNTDNGTLFVKDDGTAVMKNSNGEAVEIGKSVTIPANQYSTQDCLSDRGHYLEFINLKPSENAFDKDTNKVYRIIDPTGYEFYDYQKKYLLPWLANNPGKLKTLRVKDVRVNSNTAPFDTVKFLLPLQSGNFIELNYDTARVGNGKDSERVYDVHIPGNSDVNHSMSIYAVGKMKGGTKYLDAGKLMVANYAERNHKLIIVPVGKNYSVSEDLQTKLNDIYGRLGIHYTIELDEVFNNDSVNKVLDDGLDISADDESRWQVESDEMKTLRYYYQETHPDMDESAAYLFLVEQAEVPYETTQGDMPRNQSVGYIFMNGQQQLDDSRLVAHELGHGVYKLQHTFAYSQMDESLGTTDNLMDYREEEPNDFLAHYQWRVMQDSSMFVWNLLQEDEDGLKKATTNFKVGDHFVVRQNSKQLNENGKTIDKVLPISTELKLKVKKSSKIGQFEVVVSGSSAVTNGTLVYAKFNDLTVIEKVVNDKEYEFHTGADFIELPYSSKVSGNCPDVSMFLFESEKSGLGYIRAYKVYEKCGNYLRLDEPSASASHHKGQWISIYKFRSCVNDTKSTFDFINVNIASPSVSDVLKNRNRLNDYTDNLLFASTMYVTTTNFGSGYFYKGKQYQDPDFTKWATGSTDFEKHVKSILIEDLQYEGKLCSVNCYDGEILTLGKGNTVKGKLPSILQKIYDNVPEIKSAMNSVGIKMVGKSLCVLNDQGVWLYDKKNGSYVYEASKYIAKNAQLLSFFIELAEKQAYKDTYAKYTIEDFFESGAGKLPSFVLNADKTAYADSWSDVSVRNASHLEHWIPCGGWNNNYASKFYKESKGKMVNIIYAFTYCSASNSSKVRKNKLGSSVFTWKSNTYNYIGSDIIKRTGFLTLFNRNEISASTSVQQDASGVNRLTWMVDGTTYYLSNSNCTFVPYKGSTKGYVVTKDAAEISKQVFQK